MGKFKLRLEWDLQGKPVVIEVETKESATMYLVVDHILAVVDHLRKIKEMLIKEKKRESG